MLWHLLICMAWLPFSAVHPRCDLSVCALAAPLIYGMEEGGISSKHMAPYAFLRRILGGQTGALPPLAFSIFTPAERCRRFAGGRTGDV